MKQAASGFREIEHTADWELEVWAPDLCGLMEQAAIGMYALSGAELATTPLKEYSFKVDFFDLESLLVDFLSELLYYGEVKNIGFNHYQLRLEDNSLHAVVSGAPLVKLAKEIKAVTYHNLAIRQTKHGLLSRIVFDV